MALDVTLLAPPPQEFAGKVACSSRNSGSEDSMSRQTHTDDDQR